MLLENIIAVLRPSTYRNDVQPPMDDPAVIDAAKAHAQVRFEQGLGPVAIVTEFRLLRHEIGRALITSVDDAPATTSWPARPSIDDALDGAATVGLTPCRTASRACARSSSQRPSTTSASRSRW